MRTHGKTAVLLLLIGSLTACSSESTSTPTPEPTPESATAMTPSEGVREAPTAPEAPSAEPVAPPSQREAEPAAPELSPEQTRKLRRRGRALLNDARVAQRAGNLDEALALFDQLDAIGGSTPETRCEHGWAYFRQNDLDRAGRLMSRALIDMELASKTGEAPQLASCLYNMGRVTETDDPGSARALYTRSLDLRENATVRRRLAALDVPAAAGPNATHSLPDFRRGVREDICGTRPGCTDTVFASEPHANAIGILEAVALRISSRDGAEVWGRTVLAVRTASGWEQVGDTPGPLETSFSRYATELRKPVLYTEAGQTYAVFHIDTTISSHGTWGTRDSRNIYYSVYGIVGGELQGGAAAELRSNNGFDVSEDDEQSEPTRHQSLARANVRVDASGVHVTQSAPAPNAPHLVLPNGSLTFAQLLQRHSDRAGSDEDETDDGGSAPQQDAPPPIVAATLGRYAATPIPTVSGQLSREQVRAGFGSVQDKVSACGEGIVRVRATIAASGSVTDVTCEGEVSDEVKTCVITAVRGASFPASQQGLTVTYPFRL